MSKCINSNGYIINLLYNCNYVIEKENDLQENNDTVDSMEERLYHYVMKY